MADECLPQIIGEGLKGSLDKLELDCRIHQEVASTARAEAEKVKCDMIMQGLEFSQIENALNEELRSLRNDKKELRKKLHDKLQDAVELESKIVPMRKRNAELEEARRSDADKMSKLEKRSTERETLLGKVEQDRDKAAKELGETATELARVREENNGFKQKADELELEITRVRGENNGFKEKVDELQLEITEVREENKGSRQRSTSFSLRLPKFLLPALEHLWSSLLANSLISTSLSFLCTTKWWMARLCLQLNCSHLPLQFYHFGTSCT
ncbi:uncharacterized protein [Phaseolus vulgaris]|uniref:uncharacterized protein n=1 Tax=Phaseolus vulgaris TaxID=3885 RepID=UPI0035CC846F